MKPINIIDEIPQVCIDIFIKRFATYPSISIIEPPYRPVDFIEKSIKKYLNLWVVKKVDSEGGVTYNDVLLEYDSTGILFYIRNSDLIFILSRNDKSDIVDFTIHNLKKTK
jgi:hypothetical protein